MGPAAVDSRTRLVPAPPASIPTFPQREKELKPLPASFARIFKNQKSPLRHRRCLQQLVQLRADFGLDAALEGA